MRMRTLVSHRCTVRDSAAALLNDDSARPLPRRQLTSVIGTRVRDDGTAVDVRVVLSSGGAAGGVVSEGQGYGLLLAGLMAARVEVRR